MSQLRIAARYNGPPDSGNGGYCCGLFARELDTDPLQALQVTLRKPPPLDTDLSAEPVGDGVEILSGTDVVATVQRSSVDFEPLPAPEQQQARQAEARYPGFNFHPFPSCFVCGPDRAVEDGLRLFPGTLSGGTGPTQPVACHWQPFGSLADEGGNIRPEFIWAALDCPTYFGAFAGEDNATAVLGRQAVRCLQAVIPADQAYVIQSWLLQKDGRKRHSAGALYTEGGQCVALCQATWIELQ